MLAYVEQGMLALLLVLAAGACRPAGPSPPRVAADSVSGQAAGAPAEGPAEEETPARPSKLHVNRTETFYDVNGGSARALLRALQRRGPRIDGQRHFGRTRWTARWETVYARPAGPDASCRMRRADVYLDVDVTLPRWNDPEETPPSLQRSWSSFTDALAFHEREHRESIVSTGRAVARALEGMAAPTCTALKEKANARARHLIEECRAYNRRYDEHTRHGRTQGATWPPP